MLAGSFLCLLALGFGLRGFLLGGSFGLALACSFQCLLALGLCLSGLAGSFLLNCMSIWGDWRRFAWAFGLGPCDGLICGLARGGGIGAGPDWMIRALRNFRRS